MKIRAISGAVVLLIFGLLAYLGSIPFLFACLIIGLCGMYEIYRVIGIYKKPYTVFLYLAVIAVFTLGYFKNAKFILPISFVLIYLTIIVLRFDKVTINTTVLTVITIFYTGGFAYCLYKLRIMDEGIYNICLVVSASWCSDVGAYLAGMKFGKHHPFPVLSPKKSAEGCIGGMISAGIFGIIAALLFNKSLMPAFLYCFIGSVFSQIGDLAASAIKRKFNVKDYGKLIPGHGGIMDRFDSMLFVSAAFYVIKNIL